MLLPRQLDFPNDGRENVPYPTLLWTGPSGVPWTSRETGRDPDRVRTLGLKLVRCLHGGHLRLRTTLSFVTVRSLSREVKVSGTRVRGSTRSKRLTRDGPSLSVGSGYLWTEYLTKLPTYLPIYLEYSLTTLLTSLFTFPFTYLPLVYSRW